MTCIIGIALKGKVVIGGDSAGVSGSSLELRKDPKVFKVGECIIGFTTSFRMGQLLRFGFTLPKQKEKQDDFEYICTDFIDDVRARLKFGGYSKKKDEVEFGGTFIVGYRGMIYKVSDDFQAGIPLSNFTACGCGEEIAFGAVAALIDSGMTLKEITLKALGIVERYSAGVRSPFVIEEN